MKRIFARLVTPGVVFLVHTHKNMKFGILFSIVVCTVAAITTAGETDTIGFSPDGRYGINRLLLPVAPSRHLSISGYGGYGIFESMGPVSGAHHRMSGMLSVSGAPIKQLGLKLTLEGYHDRHPADQIGKDTTTVGAPRLGIHGGQQLGKWIQLGGALDVTIPGGAAPSLKFSSATLEPKILLALVPEDSIWRLILSAGYRWDNTGKTAPQAESLRPGDRISIGTSEYDSVSLGLGSSVSISALELIAELSSNIFVGNNPPKGSSPLRFDLGARYHIYQSLQVALLTETLIIGRPELQNSAPVMPVEPRFSLFVGVTYAFGVTPPPKPGETSIVNSPPIKPPVQETKPSPTTPAVNTTSIEGSVVDEEGNPIGGTHVSFTTEVEGMPKDFETTTDSTGSYTLSDVPVGEGTLVIEMEGFDSVEKMLVLTDTPSIQEPSTLTEVLSSPTQLRGQIRSISGDPLKAKLVITPGNHTVETDETGLFSIDLPKGKYRVIISAHGRKTQKKRVVIEENSVTIINVDLR